jgi:L-amino acid N-acyltransferase YncA
MTMNILIRSARIEDAPSILSIYSHYVEKTAVTFELIPPELTEIEKRISECLKCHAWIVCELENKIVGYTYYSKFKERKAYDYSCETTVYVHPHFVHKGIGSLLYKKLILQMGKSKMAIAIGAIALPNDASVKLHEKFGFKNIGVLKNVGRKFQKWIDVGYWELELKKMPEYNPE